MVRNLRWTRYEFCASPEQILRWLRGVEKVRLALPFTWSQEFVAKSVSDLDQTSGNETLQSESDPTLRESSLPSKLTLGDPIPSLPTTGSLVYPAIGLTDDDQEDL